MLWPPPGRLARYTAATWPAFRLCGCCMCLQAAVRPLAGRAASCTRRVVSKPGRALPPPSGIAATPRDPKTMRRPPIERYMALILVLQ